MTTELWPPVLNTHMLRAALSYRSINSDLIYHNLGSIGFGLRLNLTEPHDLLQITKLLTQSTLDYTLLLYHHHAQYQWLLFVSTNPVALSVLHQNRQYLASHLQGAAIPYQYLCGNHFLVLLRSILSPNLDHHAWPGLIDIQHKAFHTIIPNPGTKYTLAPNHIDILTPNVYAAWQSSRITLLHTKAMRAPFESPLWPWQSEHPLQNWVMSLSNQNHLVMLISTPQQAYHHVAYLSQAYAQLHIPLQVSTTPWASFLESLPFSKAYPQTTQ